MKLLLDECIDRRLARELVGYEVKTVPQIKVRLRLLRDKNAIAFHNSQNPPIANLFTLNLEYLV